MYHEIWNFERFSYGDIQRQVVFGTAVDDGYVRIENSYLFRQKWKDHLLRLPLHENHPLSKKHFAAIRIDPLRHVKAVFPLFHITTFK